MDRPGDMTGGLSEELRREVENTPFEGSYLKTKLRKYQEFGVRFILHQGNVLLGDEMGLGKTIQAIAAMVSLYSAGERFFWSSALRAFLSIGAERSRGIAHLQPFRSTGKSNTQRNYGLRRRHCRNNNDALKKIVFPTELRLSLLVADEAHYVKNKGAKRTQVLGEVRKRSNRVLYMTGTPLENNVDEMCYLVSCFESANCKRSGKSEISCAGSDFREKLAPGLFSQEKRGCSARAS